MKFGTGSVEGELSSLGEAIEYFRTLERGEALAESKALKVRWVIYATVMAALMILML